MENITYKLEAFEGPLDLPLKLIEKNKVQITDIPIALIFEQYMEYIDLMQKMDMEVSQPNSKPTFFGHDQLCESRH